MSKRQKSKRHKSRCSSALKKLLLDPKTLEMPAMIISRQLDSVAICLLAMEGEAVQSSKQGPVNDWHDQSYTPNGIKGRLPDPDNDTGSDICLRYDDDRRGSRSVSSSSKT